jgi:galactonate dehydratase
MVTQYARLDICNVGGFTEAMKVAGWCEAHYIDLMPHNPLGPVCTAASVHLAAAIPNFSWLECRQSPGEESGRHKSDVFLRQPELEGASFPLPSEPGLGVEIDESKLPDLGDFAFYEMPHFRRPDGSHTNW